MKTSFCFKAVLFTALSFAAGAAFGATTQCSEYYRHNNHVHILDGWTFRYGYPMLMATNEASQDVLAVLGEKGRVCFKGATYPLYQTAAVMVYEVQGR